MCLVRGAVVKLAVGERDGSERPFIVGIHEERADAPQRT
jgi:hypothetical protein